MLSVSCAATGPSRTPRLPAAPVPFAEPLQSAPVRLPVIDEATPSLHIAPAPAEPTSVPAPTPEAAPEPPPAAPAPEVAQPLPGGTPFMPEVERWRGHVRELIAEARAEGRLTGAAAVLNEDLVLAVIQQESGGDPNAESWAGARGLLQLMPESFAWIMGIANWGQDISFLDRNFIFDPNTNLRAGIRFLGAVLDEQGGSIYWALSSYNAGGGQVNMWRAMGYGSVPAWYGGGETANYAPAILANYSEHRAAEHAAAAF